MSSPGGAVEAQPDYSRPALARFIDFVVDKNLVHPATAQGWRVATTKVLEDLPAEAEADVRQLDVEGTFRRFLNKYPGRLSPASVGEYRRRVGRAVEEFVRWVEDPGGYAFKGAPRTPRSDARKPSESSPVRNGFEGGEGSHGGSGRRPGATPSPGLLWPAASDGIALQYPLRPDLLAQVVVPRDLTVEEARRMGAFLMTLAVDFKPALARDD
jgi:hypothetical protein